MYYILDIDKNNNIITYYNRVLLLALDDKIKLKNKTFSSVKYLKQIVYNAYLKQSLENKIKKFSFSISLI